jgi:hypothetical protein
MWRDPRTRNKQKKTSLVIQIWNWIFKRNPTKLGTKMTCNLKIETKLDIWQSNKNNQPKNIQNKYGAKTYIIKRLGAFTNLGGREPVN